MPLYSILALAWINAIVVRGGRVLLALYALNLGAEPLTMWSKTTLRSWRLRRAVCACSTLPVVVNGRK